LPSARRRPRWPFEATGELAPFATPTQAELLLSNERVRITSKGPARQVPYPVTPAPSHHWRDGDHLERRVCDVDSGPRSPADAVAAPDGGELASRLMLKERSNKASSSVFPVARPRASGSFHVSRPSHIRTCLPVRPFSAPCWPSLLSWTNTLQRVGGRVSDSLFSTSLLYIHVSA